VKFFIIILCVLSVSCEMVYPGMKIPKKNIEIEFNNLYDAWKWMAYNINYKTDQAAHGRIEEWQLPEQTYYLRTGDCEDWVLLLGYFANKLGYSSEFIIIKRPDGNHAVLYTNGMYMEAIGFGTYYEENEIKPYEVKRFSYNEALSQAEYRTIKE